MTKYYVVSLEVFPGNNHQWKRAKNKSICIFDKTYLRKLYPHGIKYHITSRFSNTSTAIFFKFEKCTRFRGQTICASACVYLKGKSHGTVRCGYAIHWAESTRTKRNLISTLLPKNNIMHFKVYPPKCIYNYDSLKTKLSTNFMKCLHYAF